MIYDIKIPKHKHFANFKLSGIFFGNIPASKENNLFITKRFLPGAGIKEIIIIASRNKVNDRERRNNNFSLFNKNGGKL